MSTTKNSKIAAFEKILLQESKGGFRDSAVIGGLDRFLFNWSSELVPIIGDIGSYSSLSLQQREQWVASVLDKIRSAVPSSSMPTPSARRTPVPGPAKKSSRPPVPRSSPKSRPYGTAKPDDDLTKMASVTKKSLPRLKRLGIEKVSDFIYLFPFRHNDFGDSRKVSEVIPGEDQTVIVTVWEASEVGQRPRQRSTQAILGDDTGNIRAVWFNQPYLARNFSPGTRLVISGKAEAFQGQISFKSPEWEFFKEQDNLIHTGGFVPIYPSTDGLPQRTIRRVVKEALDCCVSKLDEFMPDYIRHKNGLIGLRTAISQMHYPESDSDLIAARRRLAFDELFLLQLNVLNRRRNWSEESDGISLVPNQKTIDALLDSLPFQLTNAQARSFGDIIGDLGKTKPMSRMLQGDVGSGKTIVAALALLIAVINGYKGALMAPTEILSEQHFLSLTRLLDPDSTESDSEYLRTVRLAGGEKEVTIGLLLGSLRKRAKDEMHQLINEGKIDLLIGTQALIQSSVDIPDLALVVVDEQHRFGVMQRASLRERETRPHLLAMSATPIPRSLALTVYGDLDLSVIDELPPGRQPIRTRWIEPERRATAYGFVRKQVEEDHQAFIVCPLIDESEAIQARAATEEYQRLSTEVFPDLRLGLLHGRMPLKEKEEIVETFRKGELDILVSTPVIEVGIDIPNATVMLIDGADRFGLAQLHQFRGRVGRGPSQSYCLLLSDRPGADAIERMKVVERVSDGFVLAEEDLRLRGPGDYLGTRQSGLPSLRVASITDQDLLALARKEATYLLEVDPDFLRVEHKALGIQFEQYTAGLSDDIS